MPSSYYFMLGLLMVFLLLEKRKRRRKRAAVINHRLNHRDQEKECTAMRELAEQFVGRDCIIYTLSGEDSVVKGRITQVADNGLIVDCDGNMQAVNLEYVTRIREWPKTAKGKKKTVFS